MHKDNRPYVIMQMSASVDGRIAFGPGLTMFDKHPAEGLVRDAGPIWEKVADAIRTEWQPQGTMWGSGIFQNERAPLRELPAFAGDAQSLYADFLPEDVIASTKKWDILVDGRGRCRGGYKSTEKPGYHILHLSRRVTACPSASLMPATISSRSSLRVDGTGCSHIAHSVELRWSDFGWFFPKSKMRSLQSRGRIFLFLNELN